MAMKSARGMKCGENGGANGYCLERGEKSLVRRGEKGKWQHKEVQLDNS